MGSSTWGPPSAKSFPGGCPLPTVRTTSALPTFARREQHPSHRSRKSHLSCCQSSTRSASFHISLQDTPHLPQLAVWILKDESQDPKQTPGMEAPSDESISPLTDATRDSSSHKEFRVRVSASSSARARSKAKGCRAASWVPVRLAQGWQPFQHRAWLMRSILRGGFLQGSIRHLFFKPRNELTAKLTGPAAVAKLPRGRTAKQAEKRALRRARRVGTLRDSSHSRDSPATRLQVTTSRRAICARTNSSVSLHVFTFYGCKNPRSRRYGQTRSQSDSLATPLILHTRERGYFPRRPPDAANSFALCWARSAPHRQGAGKNLRSAPVLQAEDPQP